MSSLDTVVAVKLLLYRLQSGKERTSTLDVTAERDLLIILILREGAAAFSVAGAGCASCLFLKCLSLKYF